MATNWADEEVIQRWQQLFKLPVLIVRYQKHQTSLVENDVVQQIIQQWRERLMDLSWYMRMLNEYLARKANEEDNCTGRFWAVSAHPCTHGTLASCLSEAI